MNAHRLRFENRNLCAVVSDATAPLRLSMAYKHAVLQRLLADEVSK